MTLLEILALSVALAMDAFAVAVGAGCTLHRVTVGHYVRMAGAFGFFQYFMPVLGWFLGLSVRGWIESWDHWLAFLLLAWIGGNMIRESGDEEACACDPSRGRTLFLLAVATSIDALAVGLSFALLQMPVWGPSVIIGVVCAAITAAGLFLGRRLATAAALLFGLLCAVLICGVLICGVTGWR